MQAPAIDLSVVVPAYDEEKRLPPYLESILAYLASTTLSYEIIVVDDGSSDATASVVQRYLETNPAVKLLRLPQNRGKGFAVRSGMLQASGALRLFTDADGATPITELESLLQAVSSGGDVAIGSRVVSDGRHTVRAHLHRRVMGYVFRSLVNSLLLSRIRDTQCGFKLFTARAANHAFALQRIDDFGFDVEILFILSRNGYRVAEVPVNWNDQKGSKVRLLRDSVRMFLDILKVRRNDFAGGYRRPAAPEKQ